MKIIETSNLSYSQKKSILELWNSEFTASVKQNSLADFEKYLSSLKDAVFLILTDEQEKICGWCSTFERDNERWFSILLRNTIHNKSFGTMLLNKIKEHESVLNGWVIDHNNDVKSNGEVYKSPLNFYLKNGFEILPDVRLETKTISAVKIVWKKT